MFELTQEEIQQGLVESIQMMYSNLKRLTDAAATNPALREQVAILWERLFKEVGAYNKAFGPDLDQYEWFREYRDGYLPLLWTVDPNRERELGVNVRDALELVCGSGKAEEEAAAWLRDFGAWQREPSPELMAARSNHTGLKETLRRLECVKNTDAWGPKYREAEQGLSRAAVEIDALTKTERQRKASSLMPLELAQRLTAIIESLPQGLRPVNGSQLARSNEHYQHAVQVVAKNAPTKEEQAQPQSSGGQTVAHWGNSARQGPGASKAKDLQPA